MSSSLVGVNTSIPNRLTARSIENGEIQELKGYEYLRREVKCGPDSRLDILLERSDGERCFIEVKNCTLVEEGTALFPDAVTSRGLKHLVELRRQVEQGDRAVIFFLIQRMDAVAFGPADRIDPAYGAELRRAVRNGVEVLGYDTALSLERIVLNRSMPIILD